MAAAAGFATLWSGEHVVLVAIEISVRGRLPSCFASVLLLASLP
jgi:hypothetical protein